MRAVTALVCSASLALTVVTSGVTPEQAGSADNLAQLESLFQDRTFDSKIWLDTKPGSFETQRKEVVESLEFRDTFRLEQASNPDDLAEQARAIKQNPVYRTVEIPQDENWLGATIEDFFRRIGKLFEGRDGGGLAPGLNLGFLGPLGQAFIVAVIGLLIVAVGYLVYFAISRQDPKRRVKAGGLLDEDEEALASDEWLAKADSLIASGEHRLATRCLFLGSLTLCDEYRVAEFRREQTNWEHHDRIMRSRRKPESMSFTDATQRFDLVWYGERGDFVSEASWMRDFYLKVKSQLAGLKAA
ncbi:MAG: hypothetical protein KF812_01330 [Fimbriimonadaceae bacterium]|nr:hypothetical protein [Fimbriimonadaceae bacterium]